DARVHGEHDDVRVAARGEVEQPGPARPSVDRLQVDDLAADRGVDRGELVGQPRGHGSRAALLPRNALLLQGAGIVAWTSHGLDRGAPRNGRAAGSPRRL